MGRSDGFELFLVEDLILTLGNLRGLLVWLGDDRSADPDRFRAGVSRIAAQIEGLESRARHLCARLRAEAPLRTARRDAAGRADADNIFADLADDDAADRGGAGRGPGTAGMADDLAQGGGQGSPGVRPGPGALVR